MKKKVLATVFALVFLLGAATAIGGVHNNQTGLILEQHDVLEITSWGPPETYPGGGTIVLCSFCGSRRVSTLLGDSEWVICPITGQGRWVTRWSLYLLCPNGCE